MRRARGEADVLRERIARLVADTGPGYLPDPSLMAELTRRLNGVLVRVDMAVQALTE